MINSPVGTFDILPDEAKFWDIFQQKAKKIFGLYGYTLIQTPYFEQTDLFVRGIGEETDVVSAQVSARRAHNSDNAVFRRFLRSHFPKCPISRKTCFPVGRIRRNGCSFPAGNPEKQEETDPAVNIQTWFRTRKPVLASPLSGSPVWKARANAVPGSLPL